MTPEELVRAYAKQNYRLVLWPGQGDLKGPTEKGWTNRQFTAEEYKRGHRVGIMTGTAIAPDRYIHDVDIDWSQGIVIAQNLLPGTAFVFGRKSKKISHCFYLSDDPLPSTRFEDIDKTVLIELRGTKADGHVGMQTMVPPSIWSKGDQKEALEFFQAPLDESSFVPEFYESSYLVKWVTYTAVCMLLARHLGYNGFGHEVRLAWAGFLLRAGVHVDDLIKMGEVISLYCNNLEVHDVRRVVESTAASLLSDNKKVKGGPSLAKLIGDNGKAVITRINEWLGKDIDFVRDSKGQPIRDNEENIARAFRLMDVTFSYHEFSDRMFMTEPNRAPVVIDDAVTEGLWFRVSKEYRFRPTMEFFERVVRHIARENTYHAVRDYLDGLKWDGVPRLDRWLIDYAGANDTPYVQAVSAIALIAAVRRVRQPGCKYDEMLILESAQGMNKSTALRTLCPDETWFSDDLPLNVDAKQIIERTLGKWIIEASDLAGKRKAENEHLKAMLSRQIDGPARMAYARNPVERARQFILIGTTNSSSYLTDSTGSRRFWPITVKQFNVELLKSDRDQLWAEASAREAKGASIRLHESLWPVAKRQQDKRQTRDAWEDTIREALLAVIPNTNGKRIVQTDHIWDALQIDIARRDRAGAIRIAETMDRLGFKNTVVRAEGKTKRGYISIEVGDPTLESEIADEEMYDATTESRIPGEDDDAPF